MKATQKQAACVRSFRLKWFLHTAYRESAFSQKRKGRKKKQTVRLSRRELWLTILLALLMLLAMALGAYWGHTFKGQMIEVYRLCVSGSSLLG